jgi:uncharacterized protein (TIGR02246 family)
MSDDERAIRELVATWMTATRAGDTPTLLRLMSDDMIFMVPGQPPFGKEAFAAPPAAGQSMSVDGHAEVLEVQVAGEWAYLRNHIEVTVTTEGEPPARHSGYTLSILHKEPDGRWVLTRDANLVT